MPDLTNCVQIDGKLYCWNKETKKVALVTIEDLDFKRCPENVLQGICEKLEKEKSDA